jgi:hypothetical protein
MELGIYTFGDLVRRTASSDSGLGESSAVTTQVPLIDSASCCVPTHMGWQSGKRYRVLCQNCVRYPRKPRSYSVIYGDTPMHIVVAGSR